MKVALVRPMPSGESVGLNSFMICEPLELEYLYAALEAAGFQAVILDMMCEKRSLAELLDEVRPDVVAFTSYITHVNVVKGYARVVKQTLGAVPTFVGGIHAEVNPQDFQDVYLDFVICQNGLQTLVDAVKLVAVGAPAPDVIAQVPGLWNGAAKRTKSIFPPELPLPDRGSTARYRKQYNYLFHDNVALLKTSYGCPYSCDFCYCRVITEGRYSHRPTDEVIVELRGIQERTVFIVDDDFLLSPKRVDEFCDALVAAKIDKRFILFGRTDFITRHEDIVQRFASLGLHAVFIGAESFRQQDLENYSKKNSVDTTEKAATILHRHGVEPYVGIVVGPDWTTHDFRGLSRWIRQHGLELANIQPLTPMPGTACYDQFEDRLIIQRTDHERFDMTHLVIEPTNMSARRFYWELLRTYYETAASLKTVSYIYRRYGARVCVRMVRGGLRITRQYLTLMVKG